jgi:hypothetical protein
LSKVKYRFWSLAEVEQRPEFDRSHSTTGVKQSAVTAPYASVPPSTGIAMPVTNDALSDSRKTATPAISSGLAARPIGLRVTAEDLLVFHEKRIATRQRR